jgi:ribosomal protein L37E
MSSHQTPRASIRDFLRCESMKTPAFIKCPRCGFPMEHRLATFTFEDEESWDIQLPVCTKCAFESARKDA